MTHHRHPGIEHPIQLCLGRGVDAAVENPLQPIGSLAPAQPHLVNAGCGRHKCQRRQNGNQENHSSTP